MAGVVKRYIMGTKLKNDEKQIDTEKQTGENEQMPILMHTFEQMDAFVNDYVQGNYKGRDIEFLHKYKIDFQSFVTLFGTPHPNCDPLSDEYWNWEMSFFEFLSGRNYCYDSEGAIADLSNKIPTIDWDINTRVNFMHLYANFLSIVRPKPGMNVFEMGFGGGNVLELFGRCGCKVFGVDASKSNFEYVRDMLHSQNIDAKIIKGTFYDIEQFEESFDIVIFESSFHHCGEPVRLLEMINKKLSQDGRVYFLHDVITNDFDRPWGVVRYDGETIAQIRFRGWLELGYRLDFFEQLLHKTGFKLEKIHAMTDGSQMFEVMKEN